MASKGVMDSLELKNLIPFYVADTLEQRERDAVEKALAASPELQTEIAFWKRVSAHSSAAAHLSSRLIVDRALGGLTGKQMLMVDRHLNECTACAEDFARVQESLSPGNSTLSRFPGNLTWFVTPVSVAYALPIVTALVAGIVLAFSILENNREHTPAIAENRGERTHVARSTLTLTYTPQLRGSSPASVPEVVLGKETQEVLIRVMVPRTVGGGSYRAVLKKPGGAVVALGDIFPAGRGEVYDSLTVHVNGKSFEEGGRYLFSAEERLPASAIEQGLTPEPPYFIQFTVRPAGSIKNP